MCEPNTYSIEEDILAEEEKMIEKAMELLEKSAEEIENLYGRETDLTTQIRDFLEDYS